MSWWGPYVLLNVEVDSLWIFRAPMSLLGWYELLGHLLAVWCYCGSYYLSFITGSWKELLGLIWIEWCHWGVYELVGSLMIWMRILGPQWVAGAPVSWVTFLELFWTNEWTSLWPEPFWTEWSGRNPYELVELYELGGPPWAEHCGNVRAPMSWWGSCELGPLRVVSAPMSWWGPYELMGPLWVD